MSIKRVAKGILKAGKSVAKCAGKTVTQALDETFVKHNPLFEAYVQDREKREQKRKEAERERRTQEFRDDLLDVLGNIERKL